MISGLMEAKLGVEKTLETLGAFEMKNTVCKIYLDLKISFVGG
jgi:hypothetical protein